MARSMTRCWASVIGGCKGGWSKEHYLTKGLYRGNVRAVGLPWAEGQPVDLPISSLAANILCRHHNGELAQLDGEAIRLRNFIMKAVESIASKAVPPGTERCYSVDGRRIIRWFCKTICNMESLAGRVPEEVYVRRAFGRPYTPVHVYVNRLIPAEEDADSTHFRLWRWRALLKAGGETTVYIVRFALLYWLVTPFSLTPDECDAIGILTENRYWFKAKPLIRTRIIPVGRSFQGNDVKWTHELILRFPSKNRNSG